MKNNKNKETPLFDALVSFSNNDPISFHVPGHKDGTVFPSPGLPFFKDILKLDKTELAGLDDLHAADGVIQEAQQLASDYFGTDRSFFLVGGTTAGNLAMILTVCGPDDTIIVQRNSHKSIFNALELSGARAVFVSSVFEEEEGRYGGPCLHSVKEALTQYPYAKGLVLTYPDYYGKTYLLQEAINAAHEKNIPVLVDEAHGVHFTASGQLPASALEMGADIVVHSAHKMAPAMTMASFLHIKSNRISTQQIQYYLQIIQSSSPSYPLMASLDLARSYLASLTDKDIAKAIESAENFRRILKRSKHWRVRIPDKADDPFKTTIVAEQGINMKHAATLFEQAHIYPELATDSHILFIHGLAPFTEGEKVMAALEKIEEQLKNTSRHATIESRRLPQASVQPLALSYQEMKKRKIFFVSWQEAAGKVAAEPVIPYPPGIPLICKGERITEEMVIQIMNMLTREINFQNTRIKDGVNVFLCDQEKGE